MFSPVEMLWGDDLASKYFFFEVFMAAMFTWITLCVTIYRARTTPMASEGFWDILTGGVPRVKSDIQ